MGNIFEIIQSKDDEAGARISLGIRLKVGEYASIFPITKRVSSLAGFRSEIQAIQKEMDEVLKKAGQVFSRNALDPCFEFRPDMAPEEIWKILSSMSDMNQILASFNALDENKRKEVAEYILTQTNIFSGMGSMFSAQYNSQTHFLEMNP
jgi:hypothetical protein